MKMKRDSAAERIYVLWNEVKLTSLVSHLRTHSRGMVGVCGYGELIVIKEASVYGPSVCSWEA